MTAKDSRKKTGRQRLAEMRDSPVVCIESASISDESIEKMKNAPSHIVMDDRTDSIPVQFLFFKEPQRLPGSQSASSLTSYTDAKTSSRHTIDWLPSENQFRIVYHPANHPTETRYIFSSSISNYARFDPGETYGLPHGSALRPKE